MFDYFGDGDVKAIDIVNPLNENVSQEESRNRNRFDELQNAIDIYQNDHDMLTVEQNAIMQRIEIKQQEIVEKQRELNVLFDQRDNGNQCLLRAEKNLHQLSRTLKKEMQYL